MWWGVQAHFHCSETRWNRGFKGGDACLQGTHLRARLSGPSPCQRGLVRHSHSFVVLLTNSQSAARCLSCLAFCWEEKLKWKSAVRETGGQDNGWISIFFLVFIVRDSKEEEKVGTIKGWKNDCWQKVVREFFSKQDTVFCYCRLRSCISLVSESYLVMWKNLLKIFTREFDSLSSCANYLKRTENIRFSKIELIHTEKTWYNIHLIAHRQITRVTDLISCLQ